MTNEPTPREKLLTVIENAGVNADGITIVAAALDEYRDALFDTIADSVRRSAIRLSAAFCDPAVTFGTHPEDSEDCPHCTVVGVYHDIANIIAASCGALHAPPTEA